MVRVTYIIYNLYMTPFFLFQIRSRRHRLHTYTTTENTMKYIYLKRYFYKLLNLKRMTSRRRHLLCSKSCYIIEYYQLKRIIRMWQRKIVLQLDSQTNLLRSTLLWKLWRLTISFRYWRTHTKTKKIKRAMLTRARSRHTVQLAQICCRRWISAADEIIQAKKQSDRDALVLRCARHWLSITRKRKIYQQHRQRLSSHIAVDGHYPVESTTLGCPDTGILRSLENREEREAKSSLQLGRPRTTIPSGITLPHTAAVRLLTVATESNVSSNSSSELPSKIVNCTTDRQSLDSPLPCNQLGELKSTENLAGSIAITCLPSMRQIDPRSSPRLPVDSVAAPENTNKNTLLQQQRSELAKEILSFTSEVKDILSRKML